MGSGFAGSSAGQGRPPVVFDEAGHRVECVGAGRSGGEGTVFRVAGQSSTAAKLYHPAKVNAELRRKLETMAAHRPDDPTWAGRRHHSIAWVERLLFHDQNRNALAGFTMPFVDTDAFRQAHAYYDPADRLRRFGGGYTWRHLLTAAYNLASAVAAVHGQGHRVGDLRDTNVLVSPTSLVTLIDCDSFQIRDARTGEVFPTRVGTGDFLPPELQGSDFRADDLDRYHSDLFALAVLLFKFLMLGVHPFQARGPGVADAPSTEAKILRGLFPYERRGREVAPPEYAPDYAILPPPLRSLFRRAFVAGHRSPEARPAALQWVAALATEGRRLRQCAANANHWSARSRRSCPWCASARRTGSDPFPRSVGGQVEAGRPHIETIDGRREHLRSYVRLALLDDDVTAGEREFLDRLAAGLGLRQTDVHALVDAERRVAAPTRSPARPPARVATLPSTPPAAIASPRDRERVVWPVAAPVLVASALAGALAPVLAPAIAVVGVVPALAVRGQAMVDAAAGRPRLHVRALALPRLATNGYRSLVAAAPHAVPFGLVAVPAGIALAHMTSPHLPWRLGGALAAAGWLWRALFEPSAHDAASGDPTLRAARLACAEALAPLASRARRPSRASLGAWLACACLAGAVRLCPGVWWPVPR